MFSPPDDEALVAYLQALALDAGRVIMHLREAGFSIEMKADASPVTAADRQAEALILNGLAKRFPEVPVVAEEEVAAGRVPADLGDEFFLVDALDGTREFVKGGDDFTVNIALVRQSRPSVGVVYAPARSTLYSALPGAAFKHNVDEDFHCTNKAPLKTRRISQPPVIVASRSHRTSETDAFIAGYEGATITSVGSSLKFCMIATGEADLYPRLGPTMQWDTAAGDAVLRAAGGETMTLQGTPLTYLLGQTREDFLNPSFVAVGEETKVE